MVSVAILSLRILFADLVQKTEHRNYQLPYPQDLMTVILGTRLNTALRGPVRSPLLQKLSVSGQLSCLSPITCWFFKTCTARPRAEYSSGRQIDSIYVVAVLRNSEPCDHSNR